MIGLAGSFTGAAAGVSPPAGETVASVAGAAGALALAGIPPAGSATAAGAAVAGAMGLAAAASDPDADGTVPTVAGSGLDNLSVSAMVVGGISAASGMGTMASMVFRSWAGFSARAAAKFPPARASSDSPFPALRQLERPVAAAAQRS